MTDDNSIRLMLGYLCIVNEAEASLVRKVQVLDRFGLSDTEIAQICACSVQSVRDARLKGKKKSHAKKKSV
jgi:DNA-directed RNA polymerase specialized sigma24 family protein